MNVFLETVSKVINLKAHTDPLAAGRTSFVLCISMIPLPHEHPSSLPSHAIQMDILTRGSFWTLTRSPGREAVGHDSAHRVQHAPQWTCLVQKVLYGYTCPMGNEVPLCDELATSGFHHPIALVETNLTPGFGPPRPKEKFSGGENIRKKRHF